MQDINPIKAPVMVGLDPGLVKMILLIAGGLVLVILVVFLIWRFWKARSGKTEMAHISVIPPNTLALR
jgi:type VI protein secretion system component VasK